MPSVIDDLDDPQALVLECSPDPDDSTATAHLLDALTKASVKNRFASPRSVVFSYMVRNADLYQAGVGKAVDQPELDRVWADYHESVNMTYSELRDWADNPCSREASLTRAPIERNLRLLSKPKRDWDERDVRDAKRTISFNARMSAGEQGEPVSDECPLSRRDISLLNWAFDPRKSKPSVKELVSRWISPLSGDIL